MDIRIEEFYKEHHNWSICPVCLKDKLCMHIELRSNRYFTKCDFCESETSRYASKADCWKNALKKDNYLIINEIKEPEVIEESKENVETHETQKEELISECDAKTKPFKNGKHPNRK